MGRDEEAHREGTAPDTRPAPLREAFGGLRGRLLALVLLALALPAAVVSVLLDRQGMARIAAEEAGLLAAARAFAREEGTRIGQTRAVLEALSAMPGVAEGGPACYASLESIDSASTWSRGMGVVRPDGTFVCASASSLRRSNLTDRPYFRRALETRRFVVSDLVVARNGQASLAVVAALPVLAADGTVTAVLVAALNLDWVGRLAGEAGREASLDVTMLVDGAGRVLGRSPARPEMIGASYAEHPLVATMLARGEGAMRVEMLDGVRRFVAFARLPDSDAVVAVARDEEAVLAPIRADAAIAYGAVLAAVLLAIGLALWFGRAVLLRGIGAMAEAARDGGRVADAAPDLGAAPEVLALHRALATAEAARERTEARLLEALSHLETMASTDALTGLFNRRHFDTALAREWRGASRAGTWLSLVLLDADRFKAFNDRYGHPAGDACLKGIATSMQAVARRPHDQPARYGGEEFAIILPNTNPEGAGHVAERLRRLVEEAGIPHADGIGGVVTLSLGVASLIPGPGMSGPERLVAEADAALYRAKAEGRNRVARATEAALS